MSTLVDIELQRTDDYSAKSTVVEVGVRSPSAPDRHVVDPVYGTVRQASSRRICPYRVATRVRCDVPVRNAVKHTQYVYVRKAE